MAESMYSRGAPISLTDTYRLFHDPMPVPQPASRAVAAAAVKAAEPKAAAKPKPAAKPRAAGKKAAARKAAPPVEPKPAAAKPKRNRAAKKQEEPKETPAAPEAAPVDDSAGREGREAAVRAEISKVLCSDSKDKPVSTEC